MALAVQIGDDLLDIADSIVCKELYDYNRLVDGRIDLDNYYMFFINNLTNNLINIIQIKTANSGNINKLKKITGLSGNQIFKVMDLQIIWEIEEVFNLLEFIIQSLRKLQDGKLELNFIYSAILYKVFIKGE